MRDTTSAGVRVGIDIGSVALKLAIVGLDGRLLKQVYRRTFGRPVQTALEVLGAELGGRTDLDLVAGTGSLGRMICQLLGIPFFNEVTAQASAIRHLHPEARTLIEMGGQDSKLVFLCDDDAQPVADFAMNTNCAAGTGSFLDQQASRLGIRIEDEFGELALRSANPPRVAGRCSVFAKSDMIHLQQQAAPMHDIVAGLCLGLARNLKSNLGRGMSLPQPIAFCGGVAANRGVVRAIEQVFELKSGELIVPSCYAVTGALGAVLMGLRERARRGDEHGRPPAGMLDLESLRRSLAEARPIGHRLAPLAAPLNGHPQATAASRETLEQRCREHGPIDAWFGLDVGSISTKAAVIDSDGRVLAKVYLMTAGRPLDAVRQVLTDIGRQVDGLVRIRGAATTGSGRYLTGDFIGADLVINEITAQATAAAAIDPEVDTIFEIGGQDSKYIALDHGVVVDFEMNHACAAGTGSFLEEQAERLGISIKGQFADLAMASTAPIRLGERCTVFMESDMVSYQQQGARTDDLVAGLSYSIVANYINRVVGHRKIGRRVFFQGGTAFNRGVVAAFEAYTRSRVLVPPHHEVTGAIGAALLAQRHQNRLGRSESSFGGFDLAQVQCSVRSFECEHCSNNCEINEVTIPGRAPLYYGSRCDRYNTRKDQDREAQKSIPNLFAERHRLLLEHARLLHKPKGDSRPKIGLPLALSNYQLLPLWGTLLDELGWQVVASPMSSPAVVERGVEAVLSTPCFPVKVAHGHVLDLASRGVDCIWLPSITSMPRDYAENQFSQLCPYVTSLPYQVAPCLEAQGLKVRLLKPPVELQDGVEGLRAAMMPLCSELKVTRAQMRRAIAAAWQAQQDFEQACRRRGAEALASLEPGRRAVVIVSRPYNGCDSGVSLDLPGKLRRLGVLPVPMDFLDLSSDRTDDPVFKAMYWKYGQRILHAGRVVRDDPRLHAVYMSNFGCGPDSFLAGYFKRIMAPKPCLALEIDEHSADAGVITRLEAFLESLQHATSQKLPKRVPLVTAHSRNGQKRMLYIPWMGDAAYPVAAAMRGCGQPAQVIEPADAASVELGRRHCSGKECLPCIITTGDMIRLAQQPEFDGKRSAFFMPGGSGPCRFGQYHAMHQLVLTELGLGDVQVVSPSHDMNFYKDFQALAGDFARYAWIGACAIEMLEKALLALRPYETEPGRADALYARWRDRVCRLVERCSSEERIGAALDRAAESFARLPVDRSEPRPRIGVLGEVYVRLHRVANNDLVRQLESLGAEVCLAPLSEYMLYSNWTRMVEAQQSWSWRPWLMNCLQDRVQRRIHRRMASAFRGLLGSHVVDEPPTRDVLDLADPYLDRSFFGEAVLSVGKAVEMHQHGCHGVANVMPFSCMPSTIVAGLLKKIAADCQGLPVVSISYDGQQDPTLLTRLEAFVQQARAYQARSGGHAGKRVRRSPAHAAR